MAKWHATSDLLWKIFFFCYCCVHLFSSFYFWWGVGHWSLAGWVGRWQWVGSLGAGGGKGLCFKSMLFNNGHLFMAKWYSTSDFSGEILLLLSCFGGEGWVFFFGGGFPILGKWEREHVGYWPHVYIQISRHVRFIVRNLLLSWFCFFFLVFFWGNYFTRQVCQQDLFFLFLFFGASLDSGFRVKFQDSGFKGFSVLYL